MSRYYRISRSRSVYGGICVYTAVKWVADPRLMIQIGRGGGGLANETDTVGKHSVTYPPRSRVFLLSALNLRSNWSNSTVLVRIYFLAD